METFNFETPRRIKKIPIFQMVPGHGNPQERRTMFIGYLFKYCSLNYQEFHQVFENTSQ